MMMCGCTSDVEPLSPSEETVSHKHCGYDDAFVEYDNEDSSIVEDENENSTTSEIAKDYLDRIAQQLAALDEEKKGRSGWKPKRSNSLPGRIGELSDGKPVFRADQAPPSPRNDSRYPSIKHTSSDSTQSTTSLSFDELSQDEEFAEPALVGILRRKAKLADVTIEASGANVRFSPSTVFTESKGRRRPLRRKPRVRVVVQEPTEDELRRLERRSQQNQHNHDFRFSPYISHDIRSPSSELLYQSESFYVFR